MPKIINHDKRREEIANVAMKLIAEEGIGKATVRGICRRGGFSTGVIAHYFSNQKELLTYVFEWHMEKVRVRLQMTVDQIHISDKDRLELVIKTLLPGGIGQDPDDDRQFSLGLLNFMSSTPELEERLRKGYKPLLNLLTQAIKQANDIPRPQAKSLATLIMSTIDGIWLHRSLNMINDNQLRKTARQLLSMASSRAVGSTSQERTRQSTG